MFSRRSFVQMSMFGSAASMFVAGCVFHGSVLAHEPAEADSVTPNQFPCATNDSAAIQAAVDLAVSSGKAVVIPSWNARARTNLWVVSETILLPSGVTVYLDNCRLRMADEAFCNCFANRNAWVDGRENAALEEHDIRLIGRGNAVLDGGMFNGWGERIRPGARDNPDVRANCARLPKRLQHNCPIYFHNVRRFEVSGLRVYHQRYWGMCYSFCSEGTIRDIDFEADLSWVSDDGTVRDPNRRPTAKEYKNLLVKNGDGVDLRRGCHDILIENITGFTEDDTVALTNIPGKNKVHPDDVVGLCPDIHHVTIRNVRAESWRWMNLVRLLATDEGCVHDIAIDGLHETPIPGMDWRIRSAVQINDAREEYTYRCHPSADSMQNISISNVVTHAGTAILMAETIENLSVANVRVSDGTDTVLSVAELAKLKNCSVRGIQASPTARLTAVADLHRTMGTIDLHDLEIDTAAHLLRLSDSTVDVRVSKARVVHLGGERILRLEKGDKGCGGRWADTDRPSYLTKP